MKTLFIVALLCANQLAFAGISKGDAYQAEIAIGEGRIDDAKKLIGSSDISNQPGILYAALKPRMREPQYSCKNELVKFLLDKGAKPTSKSDESISPPRDSHFKLAVSNACSEIVEMFISKMTPEEIAEGTKYLSIASFESWANQNEENAARVTKMVQLLADSNKKHCPNSSESKPNCAALAHLRAEMKGVENRESESQFASSPDGIRDSACEVVGKLNNHKKSIEQQRKIAKVSGTMDIEKLHYAGARTVELEGELEGLKAEYKKLTKKNLNLKTCN